MDGLIRPNISSDLFVLLGLNSQSISGNYTITPKSYRFGNFLFTLAVTHMRVIAKKVLREFWEKHEDAEQPLKTWFKEASLANWKDPMDIKSAYIKASILKNSRVVFNICGNKYRLITKVEYEKGWVFIRFIGTHSDYDRIDAESI